MKEAAQDMKKNKNFKRLMIFGIVMMFIFASISAAGISISDTKTEETIDEKDNWKDEKYWMEKGAWFGGAVV